MERNYEIIAVDFDGTLCFSKWPECGEPNQALINYLKKWKFRWQQAHPLDLQDRRSSVESSQLVPGARTGIRCRE